MSASITIERAANSCVDRLRRYRIEIDGHIEGLISRGETLSLDRPAGPVTVRARIDWSGSNMWSADLADEAHVTLVVGREENGYGLTGLFSRDRYLSLVPKPKHAACLS